MKSTPQHVIDNWCNLPCDNVDFSHPAYTLRTSTELTPKDTHESDTPWIPIESQSQANGDA